MATGVLALKIIKYRLRKRRYKTTSVVGCFIRIFKGHILFTGAFTVATGLTGCERLPTALRPAIVRLEGRRGLGID